MTWLLKYKPLLWVVMVAFFFTTVVSQPVQADVPFLPAPGQLVPLTPSFAPALIRGLKVFKNDPFKFEFVMSQGDDEPNQSTFENSLAKQILLKEEANRLVKYFLAALTVPEKDMWVNLSPYEHNHIVPKEFGATEMGKELLAQDYLLKQLTASVMYPEGKTGREFWKKVYEEAYKRLGTTNIAVNTFNKVWIVPDTAVVYENAATNTAVIIDSKLKVMLEEDYLALNKSYKGDHSKRRQDNVRELSNDLIRQIVLPVLEKEINTGRNFAELRQVYNSLILALWFKNKLKNSLLGQGYVNRKKINGVEVADKNIDQKIYNQYLRAYRKGVYNYIKEEMTPENELIPRKYFSGGVVFGNASYTAVAGSDGAMLAFGKLKTARTLLLAVDLLTTTMGSIAAANAAAQPIPLEYGYELIQQGLQQEGEGKLSRLYYDTLLKRGLIKIDEGKITDSYEVLPRGPHSVSYNWEGIREFIHDKYASNEAKQETPPPVAAQPAPPQAGTETTAQPAGAAGGNPPSEAGNEKLGEIAPQDSNGKTATAFIAQLSLATYVTPQKGQTFGGSVQQVTKALNLPLWGRKSMVAFAYGVIAHDNPGFKDPFQSPKGYRAGTKYDFTELAEVVASAVKNGLPNSTSERYAEVVNIYLEAHPEASSWLSPQPVSHPQASSSGGNGGYLPGDGPGPGLPSILTPAVPSPLAVLPMSLPAPAGRPGGPMSTVSGWVQAVYRESLKHDLQVLENAVGAATTPGGIGTVETSVIQSLSDFINSHADGISAAATLDAGGAGSGSGGTGPPPEAMARRPGHRAGAPPPLAGQSIPVIQLAALNVNHYLPNLMVVAQTLHPSLLPTILATDILLWQKGIKGITLHSVYRPPEVNAVTLGAAKDSQHAKGRAFDYAPNGFENREIPSSIRAILKDVAKELGATGRPGAPCWSEPEKESPSWEHFDVRGGGPSAGKLADIIASPPNWKDFYEVLRQYSELLRQAGKMEAVHEYEHFLALIVAKAAVLHPAPAAVAGAVMPASQPPGPQEPIAFPNVQNHALSGTNFGSLLTSPTPIAQTASDRKKVEQASPFPVLTQDNPDKVKETALQAPRSVLDYIRQAQRARAEDNGLKNTREINGQEAGAPVAILENGDEADLFAPVYKIYQVQELLDAIRDGTVKALVVRSPAYLRDLLVWRHKDDKYDTTRLHPLDVIEAEQFYYNGRSARIWFSGEIGGQYREGWLDASPLMAHVLFEQAKERRVTRENIITVRSILSTEDGVKARADARKAYPNAHLPEGADMLWAAEYDENNSPVRFFSRADVQNMEDSTEGVLKKVKIEETNQWVPIKYDPSSDFEMMTFRYLNGQENHRIVFGQNYLANERAQAMMDMYLVSFEQKKNMEYKTYLEHKQRFKQVMFFVNLGITIGAPLLKVPVGGIIDFAWDMFNRPGLDSVASQQEVIDFTAEFLYNETPSTVTWSSLPDVQKEKYRKEAIGMLHGEILQDQMTQFRTYIEDQNRFPRATRITGDLLRIAQLASSGLAGVAGASIRNFPGVNPLTGQADVNGLAAMALNHGRPQDLIQAQNLVGQGLAAFVKSALPSVGFNVEQLFNIMDEKFGSGNPLRAPFPNAHGGVFSINFFDLFDTQLRSDLNIITKITDADREGKYVAYIYDDGWVSGDVQFFTQEGLNAQNLKGFVIGTTQNRPIYAVAVKDERGHMQYKLVFMLSKGALNSAQDRQRDMKDYEAISQMALQGGYLRYDGPIGGSPFQLNITGALQSYNYTHRGEGRRAYMFDNAFDFILAVDSNDWNRIKHQEKLYRTIFDNQVKGYPFQGFADFLDALNLTHPEKDGQPSVGPNSEVLLALLKLRARLYAMGDRTYQRNDDIINALIVWIGHNLADETGTEPLALTVGAMKNAVRIMGQGTDVFQQASNALAGRYDPQRGLFRSGPGYNGVIIYSADANTRAFLASDYDGFLRMTGYRNLDDVWEWYKRLDAECGVVDHVKTVEIRGLSMADSRARASGYGNAVFYEVTAEGMQVLNEIIRRARAEGNVRVETEARNLRDIYARALQTAGNANGGYLPQASKTNVPTGKFRTQEGRQPRALAPWVQWMFAYYDINQFTDRPGQQVPPIAPLPAHEIKDEDTRVQVHLGDTQVDDARKTIRDINGDQYINTGNAEAVKDDMVSGGSTYWDLFRSPDWLRHAEKVERFGDQNAQDIWRARRGDPGYQFGAGLVSPYTVASWGTVPGSVIPDATGKGVRTSAWLMSVFWPAFEQLTDEEQANAVLQGFAEIPMVLEGKKVLVTVIFPIDKYVYHVSHDKFGKPKLDVYFNGFLQYSATDDLISVPVYDLKYNAIMTVYNYKNQFFASHDRWMHNPAAYMGRLKSIAERAKTARGQAEADSVDVTYFYDFTPVRGPHHVTSRSVHINMHNNAELKSREFTVHSNPDFECNVYSCTAYNQSPYGMAYGPKHSVVSHNRDQVTRPLTASEMLDRVKKPKPGQIISVYGSPITANMHDLRSFGYRYPALTVLDVPTQQLSVVAINSLGHDRMVGRVDNIKGRRIPQVTQLDYDRGVYGGDVANHSHTRNVKTQADIDDDRLISLDPVTGRSWKLHTDYGTGLLTFRLFDPADQRTPIAEVNALSTTFMNPNRSQTRIVGTAVANDTGEILGEASSAFNLQTGLWDDSRKEYLRYQDRDSPKNVISEESSETSSPLGRLLSHDVDGGNEGRLHVDVNRDENGFETGRSPSLSRDNGVSYFQLPELASSDYHCSLGSCTVTVGAGTPWAHQETDDILGRLADRRSGNEHHRAATHNTYQGATRRLKEGAEAQNGKIWFTITPSGAPYRDSNNHWVQPILYTPTFGLPYQEDFRVENNLWGRSFHREDEDGTKTHVGGWYAHTNLPTATDQVNHNDRATGKDNQAGQFGQFEGMSTFPTTHYEDSPIQTPGTPPATQQTGTTTYMTGTPFSLWTDNNALQERTYFDSNQPFAAPLYGQDTSPGGHFNVPLTLPDGRTVPATAEYWVELGTYSGDNNNRVPEPVMIVYRWKYNGPQQQTVERVVLSRSGKPLEVRKGTIDIPVEGGCNYEDIKKTVENTPGVFTKRALMFYDQGEIQKSRDGESYTFQGPLGHVVTPNTINNPFNNHHVLDRPTRTLHYENRFPLARLKYENGFPENLPDRPHNTLIVSLGALSAIRSDVHTVLMEKGLIDEEGHILVGHDHTAGFDDRVKTESDLVALLTGTGLTPEQIREIYDILIWHQVDEGNEGARENNPSEPNMGYPWWSKEDKDAYEAGPNGDPHKIDEVSGTQLSDSLGRPGVIDTKGLDADGQPVETVSFILPRQPSGGMDDLHSQNASPNIRGLSVPLLNGHPVGYLYTSGLTTENRLILTLTDENGKSVQISSDGSTGLKFWVPISVNRMYFPNADHPQQIMSVSASVVDIRDNNVWAFAIPPIARAGLDLSGKITAGLRIEGAIGHDARVSPIGVLGDGKIADVAGSEATEVTNILWSDNDRRATFSVKDTMGAVTSTVLPVGPDASDTFIATIKHQWQPPSFSFSPHGLWEAAKGLFNSRTQTYEILLPADPNNPNLSIAIWGSSYLVSGVFLTYRDEQNGTVAIRWGSRNGFESPQILYIPATYIRSDVPAYLAYGTTEFDVYKMGQNIVSGNISNNVIMAITQAIRGKIVNPNFRFTQEQIEFVTRYSQASQLLKLLAHYPLGPAAPKDSRPFYDAISSHLPGSSMSVSGQETAEHFASFKQTPEYLTPLVPTYEGAYNQPGGLLTWLTTSTIDINDIVNTRQELEEIVPFLIKHGMVEQARKILQFYVDKSRDAAKQDSKPGSKPIADFYSRKTDEAVHFDGLTASPGGMLSGASSQIALINALQLLSTIDHSLDEVIELEFDQLLRHFNPSIHNVKDIRESESAITVADLAGLRQRQVLKGGLSQRSATTDVPAFDDVMQLPNSPNYDMTPDNVEFFFLLENMLRLPNVTDQLKAKAGIMREVQDGWLAGAYKERLLYKDPEHMGQAGLEPSSLLDLFNVQGDNPIRSGKAELGQSPMANFQSSYWILRWAVATKRITKEQLGQLMDNVVRFYQHTIDGVDGVVGLDNVDIPIGRPDAIFPENTTDLFELARLAGRQDLVEKLEKIRDSYPRVNGLLPEVIAPAPEKTGKTDESDGIGFDTGVSMSGIQHRIPPAKDTKSGPWPGSWPITIKDSFVAQGFSTYAWATPTKLAANKAMLSMSKITSVTAAVGAVIAAFIVALSLAPAFPAAAAFMLPFFKYPLLINGYYALMVLLPMLIYRPLRADIRKVVKGEKIDGPPPFGVNAWSRDLEDTAYRRLEDRVLKVPDEGLVYQGSADIKKRELKNTVAANGPIEGRFLFWLDQVLFLAMERVKRQKGWLDNDARLLKDDSYLNSMDEFIVLVYTFLRQKGLEGKDWLLERNLNSFFQKYAQELLPVMEAEDWNEFDRIMRTMVGNFGLQNHPDDARFQQDINGTHRNIQRSEVSVVDRGPDKRPLTALLNTSIVNELMAKGIIVAIPDTNQVRVGPNLDQKEQMVRDIVDDIVTRNDKKELAERDFYKVWAALQQSRTILHPSLRRKGEKEAIIKIDLYAAYLRITPLKIERFRNTFYKEFAGNKDEKYKGFVARNRLTYPHPNLVRMATYLDRIILFSLTYITSMGIASQNESPVQALWNNLQTNFSKSAAIAWLVGTAAWLLGSILIEARALFYQTTPHPRVAKILGVGMLLSASVLWCVPIVVPAVAALKWLIIGLLVAEGLSLSAHKGMVRAALLSKDMRNLFFKMWPWNIWDYSKPLKGERDRGRIVNLFVNLFSPKYSFSNYNSFNPDFQGSHSLIGLGTFFHLKPGIVWGSWYMWVQNVFSLAITMILAYIAGQESNLITWVSERYGITNYKTSVGFMVVYLMMFYFAAHAVENTISRAITSLQHNFAKLRLLWRLEIQKTTVSELLQKQIDEMKEKLGKDGKVAVLFPGLDALISPVFRFKGNVAAANEFVLRYLYLLKEKEGIHHLPMSEQEAEEAIDALHRAEKKSKKTLWDNIQLENPNLSEEFRVQVDVPDTAGPRERQAEYEKVVKGYTLRLYLDSIKGGTNLSTAQNLVARAIRLKALGLSNNAIFYLISNTYRDTDFPTETAKNDMELAQRDMLAAFLREISGVKVRVRKVSTGQPSKAAALWAAYIKKDKNIRFLEITDRESNTYELPEWSGDWARMINQENLAATIASRDVTSNRDPVGQGGTLVEQGFVYAGLQKVLTGWGNLMRELGDDYVHLFSLPGLPVQPLSREGVEFQKKSLKESGSGFGERTLRLIYNVYFGFTGQTSLASGMSEDYEGLIRVVRERIAMGENPQYAFSLAEWYKPREAHDVASWPIAPRRWSMGRWMTAVLTYHLNELGPESTPARIHNVNKGRFYTSLRWAILSITSAAILIHFDLTPFQGIQAGWWLFALLAAHVSIFNGIAATLNHYGFKYITAAIGAVLAPVALALLFPSLLAAGVLSAGVWLATAYLVGYLWGGWIMGIGHAISRFLPDKNIFALRISVEGGGQSKDYNTNPNAFGVSGGPADSPFIIRGPWDRIRDVTTGKWTFFSSINKDPKSPNYLKRELDQTSINYSIRRGFVSTALIMVALFKQNLLNVLTLLPVLAIVDGFLWGPFMENRKLGKNAGWYNAVAMVIGWVSAYLFTEAVSLLIWHQTLNGAPVEHVDLAWMGGGLAAFLVAVAVPIMRIYRLWDFRDISLLPRDDSTNQTVAERVNLKMYGKTLGYGKRLRKAMDKNIKDKQARREKAVPQALEEALKNAQPSRLNQWLFLSKSANFTSQLLKHFLYAFNILKYLMIVAMSNPIAATLGVNKFALDRAHATQYVFWFVSVALGAVVLGKFVIEWQNVYLHRKFFGGRMRDWWLWAITGDMSEDQSEQEKKFPGLIQEIEMAFQSNTQTHQPTERQYEIESLIKGIKLNLSKRRFSRVKKDINSIEEMLQEVRAGHDQPVLSSDRAQLTSASANNNNAMMSQTLVGPETVRKIRLSMQASIPTALAGLSNRISGAMFRPDMAIHIRNRLKFADPGGIDLSRTAVKVESSGDSIQMAFDDPAMLRLLLNSDGLTPIINDIKVMTPSMKDSFVGLN